MLYTRTSRATTQKVISTTLATLWSDSWFIGLLLFFLVALYRGYGVLF